MTFPETVSSIHMEQRHRRHRLTVWCVRQCVYVCVCVCVYVHAGTGRTVTCVCGSADSGAMMAPAFDVDIGGVAWEAPRGGTPAAAGGVMAAAAAKRDVTGGPPPGAVSACVDAIADGNLLWNVRVKFHSQRFLSSAALHVSKT